MKTVSKTKKVIKTKKDKKVISNLRGIFNTHKKIILVSGGIILSILVFLILLSVFNKNSLNKKIMTINDYEFTKSDYMIYFYSAKYNYFDEDDVSKDNLKVVIDEGTNTTVLDYLKSATLSEIKNAAIISEYARKNNIKLDEEDLKEISKEKEEYISSLGGNRKFKKFLSKNKILESSYDKMAKTDKLYNKILSKLYSDGNLYDLTEEEKINARENYPKNYFKIEQIILVTIDTETDNNLTATEINQKQMLANSILELANNGTDFQELIKKYSEAAIDQDPPYYIYYKKGELLSELEEQILAMDTNQISNVIQTKYAFHIIKKLEIDDSYFDEYLDELREDNLLTNLNSLLDEAKVIYYDAYNKIKL